MNRPEASITNQKEETSMKEQQKENTDGTEEPREMDRRQALAALGKFALFTAPIMTTLLTSKKASALSPPSIPSWS